MRQQARALSLLSGWFFIAIPFVAGARRLRCEDCGESWMPAAEAPIPLTLAAEQSVRHLDWVAEKSDPLRAFIYLLAALLVLFGIRWIISLIESP